MPPNAKRVKIAPAANGLAAFAAAAVPATTAYRFDAVVTLLVASLDPFVSRDAALLLSLSRVSRACRRAALPRLHSSVGIWLPQHPAMSSLFHLFRVLGDTGSRVGSNKAGTARFIWQESEDEDLGDEEENGDGPAGLALDDAAKRLYQTYVAHPHLATLPTELRFFGPFEIEPAARAVRRFLRICPNIRTIRLNYHSRGESAYDRVYEPHALVLHYAAEAQPLLERIVVGQITQRNEYLLPALGKFRALKHLSLTYGEDGPAVLLDDYHLDLPGPARREPYPFQLESLELICLPTQKVLDALLVNSKSSIQYLCVGVMDKPLDLSAYPNLRRVGILCGDGMFKAVVETIETLPMTVDWLEIRQAGAINALKDRMIDSDDEGDQQSWYTDSDAGMMDGDDDAIDEEGLTAKAELAQQNSFAALLAVLPDRIHRLSFLSELSEVDPDSPTADKDEQIQLVSALKRPSFLSNLVQLEVANLCKDEWFDDWDDEDRQCIRARQRPLVAVAKKRGIFLGPRECQWQQLAQEGTQMPRYFR